MNSSAPTGRRFLPTLTEVILSSELTTTCQLVLPERAPEAQLVEQAFLERLDHHINRLLRDESDECARATLAQKLGTLRQDLHQEFAPQGDCAAEPEAAHIPGAMSGSRGGANC